MAKQDGSGRVVAIFVSPAQGEPMTARTEVEARQDHGLDGDAHARPGRPRQVLLLEAETLAEFGIVPGALKENITTIGLELPGLPAGTQLEVGAARLEITKDCAPCEMVNTVQPGLLEKLQGRRGTLARVLAGGTIHVGDAIRVVG
ncbi:MAG: MOSC domain-containing protein [Candidatus Acidiferrales bacterium]